MAELTFRYATMNSGKTLDLIIRAYNYTETNQQIIIMKPSIDSKGDKKIVSRSGLEKDVDFLIGENDSILELIKDRINNSKTILIDEAQFLNSKQVDELFIITKVFNIDVVCYGLRLNFKMESFEGSKRLLEISENLEEFKSLCECGKIARYVGRKINDEYVLDGQEIVIDGTDNVKYVPLCGECYLKNVKKINFEKIKKKVR